MTEESRGNADDFLDPSTSSQTHGDSGRDERLPEDLTPEDFLRLFREGRTEEIEGRGVRGNVSLYGETISIAVRALDVTFWGEVDFSECRFDRTVDLTGCHFAKTLSFHNTHIGGSLDLSDCLVRTASSANSRHLSGTRSIDLTGVRVENDLILDRLTVEFGLSRDSDPGERGMLHATNMRVGGRCEMRAIRFDGAVDISGSTFEGDLTLASVVHPLIGVREAIIRGYLEATNCRFGGNINLQGVQIGFDANFWSSTFDSIFFVRPLKTKDGVTLTRVGGDLNLANTRVAYFDAEALQVGQLFTAFSSTFGQFRLTFSDTTTPSIFGQMLFSGNSVENDLSLLGLVVTGDHISRQERGLRIEHCSVGGSLQFWDCAALLGEGNRRRIDPERGPAALGAWVHGDLSIVGCTIAGELDLTNLTATGRIVLDDTEVTRDMRLRSVATSQAELRRAEVKLTGPDDAERLVTRTQALSMTNLVCRNEVDLTGLRLIPDDYPEAEDIVTLDTPCQGHVDARGCEVQKALRLFAPLDRPLSKEGDCCPGNFADITGALNLSGARLGKFVLSFKAFEPAPNDTNCRPVEIGLVLSSAVIDEFSLATFAIDGDQLRIPRPINLRDVKVNRWHFFNPLLDPQQGLSRSDAYLSLIRADPDFRRQTYISIEQNLRNRAYAQDADSIYREMVKVDYSVQSADRRKRARTSFLPWWLVMIPTALTRKPLQFIFRRLLGYGTQPMQLLAWIFVFWLVMLPVFSTPENFEPSLSMLGAETTRYPPGQAPDADEPPKEWPALSGIAASLRYHLPVVALTVRDEWDPRETGSTCYSLPEIWRAPVEAAADSEKTLAVSEPAARSCPGMTVPISPEDLAWLIAILNWIAWPFVLAFAIGRFLRVDRG